MSQKHGKYWLAVLYLTVGMLFVWGCAADQPEVSEIAISESAPEEVEQVVDTVVADVVSVEVTGDPNAYRFSVEIASPDTGCDQYADWWEVLSEDGALIYRRILAHSHTEENGTGNPFTRDGGPVALASDQIVVVRAHMNNTGYVGEAMQGSAESGFVEATEIGSGFAIDVEDDDPQPEFCAF